MSFVSAPMVSSENGDWQTPAVVLDLVRELGGGVIALDPATVATNPVGASVWCTPQTDGLSFDWTRLAEGGLTFLNPPYGRAIVPWTRKLRLEGAAGCELVALVPARTDTAWWQDDITTAAAVCFWRGRLKFVGAKDAAPFPSALAYWGRRVEAFARVFGARGWITRACTDHDSGTAAGKTPAVGDAEQRGSAAPLDPAQVVVPVSAGGPDPAGLGGPAPIRGKPAPKRLQVVDGDGNPLVVPEAP